MLLLKNQSNLRKIKASDLVFAFFIITRIAALIFSFPCITDVWNYLGWSAQLKNGLHPYSQFSFEYPPLTLVPIYLSGLVSKQNYFASYYIAFASLMFLADCCTLKLCQKYCKDRLLFSEKEICYMSLLYSLFGFALFRIIYHRLDVIVGLFFVLFLFSFQAKNPKLDSKFFINGLIGFFYKITPVFVVPAAIIIKAFSSQDSSTKAIKKVVISSAIFVLSLITIVWALEVYSDRSFIKNMLFHQRRGMQIESSYASILLLKNLLNIGSHAIINQESGGFNIVCGSYFGFIAKILGMIILFCFYAALFFIFLGKKRSGQKIKFCEEQFLDVTLIIILLLLSFQRVLSPQFFVWLIPISAIWLTKNRSIKFLIIFSFLFLGSFFIFSIDYLALTRELPLVVVTIILRNFILVVFTTWLTINFLKKLAK